MSMLCLLAMMALVGKAQGDVTALWDFKNVNPSTLTGTSIEGKTGTVPSTVEGIELYVDATNGKFSQRGSDAQVNANTIIRVPVKNAGDEVTITNYPGYHAYTVAGTAAEEDATTYKAKSADATNGYVEILITEQSYLFSIQVVQYAPKSSDLVTVTDQPATATFTFNLGTEGQKATFSNSNYFLSSKVELGSNMTYYNATAIGGKNFTLIQPEETTGKTPGEGDFVKFTFQPKPGLNFTPTKVSLKASKVGTGNGTLDIIWQNADGTKLTLQQGTAIQRNNASPAYSSLEYTTELASAKAGDGACGVIVNIYGSLANNKQVGLCDVIIEGTLTGTEKDMPVLASVTINGNEYSAEDVFGGGYEGSVKISKTATMVSSTNPVTAIAASGEVGTITYDGNATSCTVTIPMTKGQESANYVLSVVQKPDYKVEYISGDGTTVLKTQMVEEDAKIGAFAYDIANVPPTREGWKARGWFKKAELGGLKYTVNDVITKDVKLYTVETEEEVASPSRTYDFDLRNQYFYVEDHEAFTPSAGKWNDKQHGWAFSNGNTITLLVGTKATISFKVCKFSKEGSKIVCGTKELEGYSATDGAVVTYEHDGEAGELVFTISSTGSVYIHGVTIENKAEDNYTADGQWIRVKAGDANSFLTALDYANKTNTSTSAARLFIYLPNGTYDLGSACNTPISGSNISIIGENMEKTIIVNSPHFSIEGIGTTETLTNTGTGNYLQDLTLKNALDYYGAQDAGMAGGRAVCFWDKGTKTVMKNVTMLSHQDTYYSNNDGGMYYMEDCDIHGTVDFFCGNGTLFVENSTITLEKRTRNGSGGNTITAPATAAGKSYGYVFNNCTIKNLGADYNYARAWQGEPRCAWLNTILSDNKITAKRWTEAGMNVVAKEFVEYNTKDANGSVVSPASNVVKFTYGSATNEMETILNAEQAAKYTLEKVFTSWAPATIAAQVAAPTATYASGSVTWSAVDGATAYALFKNNELVGITPNTSYSITVDPEKDKLTIRSANARGGFGTEAHVAGTTGIDAAKTDARQQADAIYTLQGVRVNKATKGIYIINGKKVVIK